MYVPWELRVALDKPKLFNWNNLKVFRDFKLLHYEKKIVKEWGDKEFSETRFNFSVIAVKRTNEEKKLKRYTSETWLQIP